MNKQKNAKKPAARKPATGKKKSVKPQRQTAVKPTKKSGAGKQTKKSNDIQVQIKRHDDKNGGHNHVIVGNVDDRHVSVGLTTKAKKGKNAPNYKLDKSPLQDGKQSFMRRQGSVYPKKEYYDARHGTMTKKDYAKAKEYGERAKQKYIAEKDKKSNEVPNISVKSISRIR